MANYILNNTTGEINCAISQSYIRLTGNYVGPLSLSSCATSGFSVRDANNCSGIYVANCAIQIAKNKIQYTEPTSVCNFVSIILPPDKCLNISGNNSLFSFSNNGNFSVGSGVYAPFNGIQSFASCPSFIAIQNTPSLNNSFRSLNCNCAVEFYICQSSNSGVCISGSNFLRFESKGSNNGFYISGNSISISGNPDSRYALVNYGSTYLGNNSLISGNLNLSGIQNISTVQNITGLNVNTCAIFCRNAVFYGDLISTGGKTFFSDGAVSFKTGFFPSIATTGSICVSYITTSDDALNTFCGCLNVKKQVCTPILCSDLISGLIVSGRSGWMQTLNVQNSIFSTGLNGCFTNLTGCFIASTNISGSSISATNSIFSTGIFGCFTDLTGCSINSTNLSACSITGINSIFSTGITGCYVNLSGRVLFAGTLCQTSGNIITCLASSGLHIGTNCSGYVKAVNTAKAWGVFSLNNGIPTLLTGYNVGRITLPITGIAASGSAVWTASCSGYFPTGCTLLTGQWLNPYVMYGLNLCETVKAPFAFNLQFHPVGCFDAFAGVRTGYLCTGDFNAYSRTGFATIPGFGYYSGSTGNLPTVLGMSGTFISIGWQGTGLINSWGPLGSYICSQQIPIHSTLVNCAGKNIASSGNWRTGDFSKITFGCDYGEVIFNLLPACMTSSSRDYYRIGNNSLNGTGTFTIFSY
jgi:hypothetical protein